MHRVEFSLFGHVQDPGYEISSSSLGNTTGTINATLDESSTRALLSRHKEFTARAEKATTMWDWSYPTTVRGLAVVTPCRCISVQPVTNKTSCLLLRIKFPTSPSWNVRQVLVNCLPTISFEIFPCCIHLFYIRSACVATCMKLFCAQLKPFVKAACQLRDPPAICSCGLNPQMKKQGGWNVNY